MKISVDELSGDERKAVEELRMRVRDSINPNMYQDILMFYRFLEAREFRINDAEKMLRKHITWIKVYQVDTILEDFKPKKVFQIYIEPTPIAFDKEGCLVIYSPNGQINIKDFFRCEKKHNMIKYFIYSAEKYKTYMYEENKKSGRNAKQLNFIVDFNNLTFENAVSRETAECFLLLINAYQDNYPEFMKAIYIINAPAYYIFLLEICKSVMSNKMIKKIQSFGYSGWKEKLLEIIDADSLPSFLGGNRTDPDGDPLCKTSVMHGGVIPPEYYLTDKARYFQDKSRVNTVLVPNMERKEIYVDVKQVGTVIQWEFYCKSNIGFGLFYEQSDKKLDEIIPIIKYDTSDGTEENSYKARYTGRYVIVFDNTFSWVSKKEVEYRIDIVIPEI